MATDLEAKIAVYNLEVYVEMTTYPVSADANHKFIRLPFTLTVQAADCDCSLISYIAPASEPLLITA